MTAYTGYKLFIKGEMDQHLNDAPVTEHKQEICSTFKNWRNFEISQDSTSTSWA